MKWLAFRTTIYTLWAFCLLFLIVFKIQEHRYRPTPLAVQSAPVVKDTLHCLLLRVNAGHYCGVKMLVNDAQIDSLTWWCGQHGMSVIQIPQSYKPRHDVGKGVR